MQEQEQEFMPYEWLWDAPLFIAGDRIDALYHGVALPETEEEYRTLTDKVTNEHKVGGKLGAQISGSAGAGLFGFLPKIALKGNAQIIEDDKTGGEQTTQYTMRPVNSAERRLSHVSLYYAQEHPDRWITIVGPSEGDWMKTEFIDERPRGLVFLDISPRTPIIPMAAEVDGGEVKTFFEALNKELTKPGDTAPPKWPGDKDESAEADYWDWYIEHHEETSKASMRLMERVIGDGGRPSWVDYRIPITGPGDRATASLHLHVKGGEEYSTGDFAHRLVRRGSEHGLRVVGLLKGGPALNVLAVFER